MSDENINDLPPEAQAELEAMEARKNDGEEAEEKEFELTPEIEEMIMEKVQYINENGTAFTVITNSIRDEKSFEKKLRDIFSYGLLGRSSAYLDEFLKEDSDLKKEWVKDVRKKESFVYFNIVGKTARNIEWSYYVESKSNFPTVALVFDLSRFKEVPYQMPEINEKDKLSHHSYQVWHPEELSTKKDDHSEWGLALSPRISPKDFQGIVSTDPTIDDKILEIQKEIFKDKKELLLPIYDEVGELLWPKFMTRDEVKQYVAERDVQKNQDSDSSLRSE